MDGSQRKVNEECVICEAEDIQIIETPSLNYGRNVNDYQKQNYREDNVFIVWGVKSHIVTGLCLLVNRLSPRCIPAHSVFTYRQIINLVSQTHLLRLIAGLLLNVTKAVLYPYY